MWWKIHIPVTSSEVLEEAGSELVEITGHGIDIQDGEVIAYTDQKVSLSTLVSDITDWRKNWFREVQNHAPLQIEPLKDENWNENWKNFFKPLPIGKRWIICPSWEKVSPSSDKIVITIDPGRAYGSGKCATTALCLELLEEVAENPLFWHNSPPPSVLDIGTGILAIAAARIGAKVTAFDIDPDSLNIAAENAKINNVKVTVTSPDLIPSAPIFDLVLANLTAHTLISYRDQFVRYPTPDAKMIFSGIQQEYLPLVLNAYEEVNWKLIKQYDREEWTALLLGFKPNNP